MTPTSFDLRAPLDELLPDGRLFIDASAGTGKTYSVAGIVARALIEQDLAPDSVLVTTFTRAAAGELRQRIRQRLSLGVQLLQGDRTPDPSDVVAAALLDASPEEQSRRVQRARHAVADFDAATIGTIHSFCQRILRLAGSDAGVGASGGSATALLDEVLNDRIIRDAVAGQAWTDEGRLRDLARCKLGNPTSTLFVNDERDAEVLAVRDLIADVVAEVDRRQARHLSYDGLLKRAHALVTHAGDGALARTLRDRYRLVIVDEAQDTDPLQWQLLDALFPKQAGTRRTLVVVGDPKQSIYGFRGADVDVYVQRRAEAAAERTLDTNFRSDQPLLDQLNALFGACAFGRGISYRRVHATAERQESRLPAGLPVTELLVPTEWQGRKVADAVARRVAHAVADRRWRPREIAVLVGTRVEAAAVVAALRRLQVAAVSSGTANVAQSVAATELKNLLRALAEPSDARIIRLAGLGWFGSTTPGQLAADDDEDQLLPFRERLHGWRTTVARRGISALVEALRNDVTVLDRMAATNQLARHLTDLQHLQELLHDATDGEGSTPTRLLAELQALATMEDTAETVTRRIETDAEAVQVMTIHAAKGLQFPFVVVAKKWGDGVDKVARSVPHARLTTDATARAIDCGHYHRRSSEESKKAYHLALQDEDDRLLYVAVTRAQHELAIVVSSSPKGPTAPHRCFGLPEVTDASKVAEVLAPRMGRFGDRFRICRLEDLMVGPPPVVASELADATRALVLAPTPRRVEAPHRHWSFTTITSRPARRAGAATAIESDVLALDELAGADEGEDGTVGSPDNAAGVTDAAPSIPAGALGPIPAGKDVGTALHAVLEQLDFAAADRDAVLRDLLGRHADTTVLRKHHEAIRIGLTELLDTPLGNATPIDFCLADVTRADRLDELRFDLTVPDRRPVPVARIGALLCDRLSSTDPLLPWATSLAKGAVEAPLLGMLNGSIDLIVRHPVRRDQFLIADYKSNRLASYDAMSVQHAMEHHHYPLQGLLYSVALHRYLRWRTGESDPSHRLAGFAYLFVRGMRGPETPVDAQGRRAGVFHWQAPPGLIAALSDLLSRGEDS